MIIENWAQTPTLQELFLGLHLSDRLVFYFTDRQRIQLTLSVK